VSDVRGALALACLCIAMPGCGGTDAARDPRAPVPAPRVRPPYGNYVQAGTNDLRIPRLLMGRLELSFPLVFTQDRDGFATPGARNPSGRFEITGDTTEAELRALLESGPP
jgi:hypothetical protein